MEVRDVNELQCNFGAIPKGGVFVHEGRLYLRAATHNDAVDLSDGDIVSLPLERLVIPKPNAVIYPEGQQK